jgi:hypothetical protein
MYCDINEIEGKIIEKSSTGLTKLERKYIYLAYHENLLGSVNNATFDICYKAILEINKKNMVTF